MEELTLNFMGYPTVRIGEHAVAIPRKRSLGLLTYLAVTGRPHGRDELTALLHPRDDRLHARRNLRTTLHGLRDAIGPRWLPGCGSSVCLSTDGVFVDVRRFREILGEGETRPGLLAEAVDLCRGEFLSGFYLRDSLAFDEWQYGEGESIRRACAWALERLVTLHAARQEMDVAIGFGRRLLNLDPQDERVVYRLMALYADTGRPADAIRLYDHYELLLGRDKGQEPDPEVWQLHRSILAGKLGRGVGRP